VRTDRLEQAVWHEVCQLLEDPQRLGDEYQRRLDALQAAPGEAEAARVDKQIAKLRQGITRLIDGYAEGYLEKAEAEPRIRRFKERLQTLEAQAEQGRAQAQQQRDLQLIIGRLEEFSAKVKDGLAQLDWHGCRELIRTLIKRVEIDHERITVVFRVGDSTFPGGNDPFLQHCRGRER
jgi:site-specific DNA recombinase